MYKFRKIVLILFALILLATVGISGTLAYENLTAAQWAEQTTQTIEVHLVQQQRAYNDEGKLMGLEDFKDHGELVPLVESAQYDGTNFDKYGMPTAEGYVDQIVRVKNTGTADAYVRVIVAVPAALDDANDAGRNALHWNLGNRFMPDGDFAAEKNTNEGFETISWKFSETAVVNGVNCNVYIFTYNEQLKPNDTTAAAAFVGFYLDPHVEIVNGHILLDGVDTGFTEDTVKIPVWVQAVQCYEMGTAAKAFETANISTEPWLKTYADE